MRRYDKIILKAPCPERAPDGVFTAILLNYKRPQNIELLLRMLLQVPLINNVIISNNNPACDLSKWFFFTHPRVRVVEQFASKPCAERYFIARETSGEYFVCIDDDLFLLPSQVQKICEETLKDPSVLHGMFGQELLKDGTFRHAVSNHVGRIDIISRLYVFSRPVLLGWHELLRETGSECDQKVLRQADDLLLSFAGTGLPLMHDVGPYLDCCTQGEKGVATWRDEDFFATRDVLFQKLKSLRCMPSIS